jgi:hypothetical protein
MRRSSDWLIRAIIALSDPLSMIKSNGTLPRIRENVERAYFIVANLTEARPNCYCELGMAHGLGKDVILLSNTMTDVHFDVRDTNVIVYGSVSDLKSKLEKRIRGTIAQAKIGSQPADGDQAGLGL